jgi:putative transposase
MTASTFSDAQKAKLRDDRALTVGPNDIRAMDFVHDQLATGWKLRVLTVVVR